MNELKVFQNSEFGELGVMMIDGKEYFPATQCAKILGYADPFKAVKQHCDEEGWVNRPVLTNGGSQNVKFITEGNLYRLIVRSKLPAAKRFERWVFDEVLPEIRRTGGYGSVNIEEVITKAVTTAVSETVKALIPLITAPQTSEKRVAIICKPKVRYKIDLLPAEIRKQIDKMLCSGKYTSKEVSKYIQEQTGLYISYVTLCNYKKTNFIRGRYDDPVRRPAAVHGQYRQLQYTAAARKGARHLAGQAAHDHAACNIDLKNSLSTSVRLIRPG